MPEGSAPVFMIFRVFLYYFLIFDVDNIFLLRNRLKCLCNPKREKTYMKQIFHPFLAGGLFSPRPGYVFCHGGSGSVFIISDIVSKLFFFAAGPLEPTQYKN